MGDLWGKGCRWCGSVRASTSSRWRHCRWQQRAWPSSRARSSRRTYTLAAAARSPRPLAASTAQRLGSSRWQPELARPTRCRTRADSTTPSRGSIQAQSRDSTCSITSLASRERRWSALARSWAATWTARTRRCGTTRAPPTAQSTCSRAPTARRRRMRRGACRAQTRGPTASASWATGGRRALWLRPSRAMATTGAGAATSEATRSATRRTASGGMARTHGVSWSTGCASQ